MSSQKQSVFDAVVAFCEENGIHFDEGMKFEPTKDQRATIVEMVARAMESGAVNLKPAARAKYDTFEKLKGYCNGLVSNWLRKDTRLNGGVDYKIQNPGSRAGSGDQIIKELRKLKSTLTQDEEKAAVEAEIQKRLAALQAEKTKKVEINSELIPAELRHLVNG